MAIDFKESERSTVGLEWELQLVDPATGRLSPCAPGVFAELARRHPGFPLVHSEMLQIMVEFVSRKRTAVAECARDMQEALAVVEPIAAELGACLVSAGSHPFAEPSLQPVSETERYEELVERTQYWGHQMLIFGTHVHVGIEDRRKVIPILNHLTARLGHIQAFAASSPFWAGIDTGYADNRAMMFQQLPTAGLPHRLRAWEELDDLVAGLLKVGAIRQYDEIRWDVRPSPKFGTIEVRACDANSNLAEVCAVAALVHCLVETASRELDAGREPLVLPREFAETNKWRAARYGMDAVLVENADGDQAPLRESFPDFVAGLESAAEDLGCTEDLAACLAIARGGVGYERQREVARLTGGLQAVVAHLRAERLAGRPLDPSVTAGEDAQ